MQSMAVSMIFIAALAAPGWEFIGELYMDGWHPSSIEYDDMEQVIGIQLGMDGDSSSWSSLVLMELDGSIRPECGTPVPASSSPGPEFVSLFSPVDPQLDHVLLHTVSHLDLEGNTLWTTSLDTVYGYETGSCLSVPAAGGGCITASAPSSGSDLWKLYRLGPEGEVIMETGFHLQGGPVLYLADMEETDEGSVLLAGVTDSLGLNLYMFLLGFDGNGRNYLFILEDLRFHAAADILELDAEGSIYVAGHTGCERQDGFFMPPLDTDVFLMKLDPDGNVEWCSEYPMPLENRPVLMDVTDGRGVFLLVRSSRKDGSPPRGPCHSVLHCRIPGEQDFTSSRGS